MSPENASTTKSATTNEPLEAFAIPDKLPYGVEASLAPPLTRATMHAEPLPVSAYTAGDTSKDEDALPEPYEAQLPARISQNFAATSQEELRGYKLTRTPMYYPSGKGGQLHQQPHDRPTSPAELTRSSTGVGASGFTRAKTENIDPMAKRWLEATGRREEAQHIEFRGALPGLPNTELKQDTDAIIITDDRASDLPESPRSLIPVSTPTASMATPEQTALKVDAEATAIVTVATNVLSHLQSPGVQEVSEAVEETLPAATLKPMEYDEDQYNPEVFPANTIPAAAAQGLPSLSDVTRQADDRPIASTISDVARHSHQEDNNGPLGVPVKTPELSPMRLIGQKQDPFDDAPSNETSTGVHQNMRSPESITSKDQADLGVGARESGTLEDRATPLASEGRTTPLASEGRATPLASEERAMYSDSPDEFPAKSIEGRYQPLTMTARSARSEPEPATVDNEVTAAEGYEAVRAALGPPDASTMQAEMENISRKLSPELRKTVEESVERNRVINENTVRQIVQEVMSSDQHKTSAKLMDPREVERIIHNVVRAYNKQIKTMNKRFERFIDN